MSDTHKCDQMDDGLDALRIGVMLVDESETIRYANAHLRYILPSVGGFEGRSLSEIASAATPDLENAQQIPIATRNLNSYEPISEDLVLNDGRVYEIKHRQIPEQPLWVLLWQDVTVLRRQTRRIEHALDVSSEGFAFFDANGGLALCNEGFTQALGPFDENARPRVSEILAVGREREAISIVGDPADLDAQNGRARDFLLHHQDGRYLRLRVRPMGRDAAVAVLTDYTTEKRSEGAAKERGGALARTTAALKATEERVRSQTLSILGLNDELLQAQRDVEEAHEAKRAILRTVGHELRTPLNSIIGFSELLEMQIGSAKDPEGCVEYAKLITEGGKRLLLVINQLIELSRLDSGMISVKSKCIDPAPTLRRAISAARERAEPHGITIAVEDVDDAPDVQADASALATIAEHLLNNAINHTEEGGVVTVRLAPQEEFVVLTVTDTGPGVPEADFDRVHRAFEKGPDPLRQVGVGIGLGLPIVQGLCEELGGAFELSCTAGRGCVAAVSLPAVEVEGERNAA